MTKLAHQLTLAIVALMLAIGSAAAQDKKPDPKKDPQDKPKTSAGNTVKKEVPGTIEIFQAKDGGYRFRIKDTDGKVICMPTKSYENKAEVTKLLALIKETLISAKPIDIKSDK